MSATVLNETVRHMASDINQFTFNSTDYVVFVLMLAISAGIGIYFGFFNKGADTTEEYLMGGRRMKTIPIAISLVASQLSGISIMTIPSEIYTFGINWFYNVVAIVIVIPVLCWIVIPVFYNNNISNCYEYLQMRFNRKTRELLTSLFMLTGFCILPVFIFMPALAFAQVTGINIHLINTVVCSICVFYTMFGGIKAVVWTDVIQAFIMMGSVTLVGILAAIKIGGFGEVFRISTEGGRINSNFTFDLRTRSTFWNNFLGSFVMYTAYVGFNQSCVQRIVSLPSLGHAKRALFIFGAGIMLIKVFNVFTGLAMYARYHDCDPLLAGLVQKPDKMMPFFVQDVVGHLSGMPGVFISCVFSAALSTMSATLNSLSGVVYMAYIKPYIKHTEQKANFIMKLFVFLAGIYCIFAGFLVEKVKSILQMTYFIGGSTMGAVFGVFILGMLVPKAHGRAALYSMVCCVSIMLVIIIGAQGRVKYETLPGSLEACPEKNITTSASSTSQSYFDIENTPFNIFDISFNWFIPLGTTIYFIFGLIFSYVLPPEKNYKLNPKLLSPIVQKYAKYELANSEEEMTVIQTEKPIKI